MTVTRTRFRPTLLAAAFGLTTLSGGASAASSAHLDAGLQSVSDQGIRGFYRARANRPLWTANGHVDAAARTLVGILRNASLDGMNDGEPRAAQVEAALVRTASGTRADLASLELLLSRNWVDYVRLLRRPVDTGMVYAAGAHSPAAPFTAQILRDAGEAEDLSAHLRATAELNPVYSQLRAGLAALHVGGSGVLGDARLDRVEAERKLRVNMDRARALPLPGDGSFILVDTSSARMFLYRDGRVRDSMRVAVGKVTEATPMVAGSIQNVVLNPYWNVPPDLVRKKAAGVVKDGVGSIAGKGFQFLSDWSDNPKLLDAKSIDWVAVADGRAELRMRQLPGAGNAMGVMKFTFANDFGIYLHDTPDKGIFAQADRRLSSGCVRVEDAKRLAGWLFGRAPTTGSSAPEQVVATPKAMPVFVTYLTASFDGGRLAFGKDGYGRDAAGTRMASNGSARGTLALNK